ncbi:MAG TPA: hypothetical protein VLJ44_06390 [Gaiellaceae bacterium]|nr:hypothetical protein [Gaiellaceae bacterium]
MRRRRSSTLREWVALGYGAVGIGLLPWAFWLSSSLPPTHHSAHWDVAWSGFDVALAACFCGTAVAAHRLAIGWAGVFAAATGTMLVVDAWFDVILESHGNELGTAIVLAVVFELPAAAVCFWIAFRTERFVSRALHLAPAGERAAEGDLVRVLEVPADGQAAREAGDADASS